MKPLIHLLLLLAVASPAEAKTPSAQTGSTPLRLWYNRPDRSGRNGCLGEVRLESDFQDTAFVNPFGRNSLVNG
jgi:hypothetical protein